MNSSTFCRTTGCREEKKTILFYLIPAFFLLFLTLLPRTPLLANDNAVTIEDAYSMAIATNELVRIAGEGLSQAQSGVSKATSRLLPSLAIDSNYTRYTKIQNSGGFIIQPDESSVVDVRLTQPIYTGGRDWSARSQALMAYERSREGLGFSKDNIIRDTARAYYGVLKAEKNVEIKKAALKRAIERGTVASARFSAGEVTKAAVLRAEAETAGAEAELTKAKSNVIDAKNILKRTVGIKDEIEVVEPVKRNEPGLNIDDLIKKAYESRRDYRQSVLDEKVASEGVTYAKGGFLPSLSLQGLYSWNEQSPKTVFFQRESTSASIVLSYPIFEGGLRKAELSEARSKCRESELRRLGLKRDIDTQVREAYNNLESIMAVIDSYKKQISFAEENYNMVFGQYKYGIATTVDVIDADTTLISAQRSLMNATYDRELAILELKYTIGAISEETGTTRARQ